MNALRSTDFMGKNIILTKPINFKASIIAVGLSRSIPESSMTAL
jgi:hypothetical protein